jgi:hypothetical protein
VSIKTSFLFPGMEDVNRMCRNDATTATRRRFGLATTIPLDTGEHRQTKLQREFPLHVVCSWLGNSPRIAQQSYLLVTEDDFAKASGAKVMVKQRGAW